MDERVSTSIRILKLQYLTDYTKIFKLALQRAYDYEAFTISLQKIFLVRYSSGRPGVY